MNTSLALIAFGACMLLLGACDQTPAAPPTPTVSQPLATESGATAGSVANGSVANGSVPSADSVFAPANAAKADPPSQRSNSTMSAAQQSTAMPMPGQNNDHSAPLGPAKRASSP